ncbi:unnamed protein product [Schistosoma margrebowiei]|uniref:Tumor necrosis factor alpha-induced protein 8-like protein 2 n=1 Tax=Schistosoma margrebowiei TaxID=48269 RepID=A0A183MV33_9TREM|nr:unnamed protein product [Schistosoma margrebowiei]VDP33359.1 unnamed protein product [Schistosoma margrebowiei]
MTNKPIAPQNSQTPEDSTERFDPQSISLRAQKKLVGNLPKGIIKLFLDDSSARLFENIFSLIKQYTGNNKLAAYLTKQAIKLNVKALILISNDILSDEQLNHAYEFHEKCHQIAEIALRLGRPKRRLMPGVEPSIDKLIQTMKEANQTLIEAVKHHISQQSQDKFKEFSEFFCRREFVVEVFTNKVKYSMHMEKIYDDLEDMMDRGLF